MPRKKIVRKVVDSDKPIKPQDALEILGIVTNNETVDETPVEESVIEEFVKKDTAVKEVFEVEEVPEVRVPKIHHVNISYRPGPYEHAKVVGIIHYHELTNSIQLDTAHPRCDAVFDNFMKSDYPITENGILKLIVTTNKQDWIENLCNTTIGYKFEASEAWTTNEVE